MGRHRGPRILRFVLVVLWLVAVALWSAAFFTSWRHEHSAVRVISHAP